MRFTQAVRRHIEKRAHLWLLLLLFLCHLAANLIILKNDTTPLLWDGGDYFYRSLRYHDLFRRPGAGFWGELNSISTYRPPLFLLASLPLYLVFGRTPDVAAATNLLFLFVLIFSVYGIGRRLHSRAAGLLAAFIVSVFPILFGLSRSYWLDFPLTAMTSLSIYLLLRSDGFRSRSFSVLFGLSCALGMLTKWSFFIFCAGPLVYVLLSALRERKEREKGSAGAAGRETSGQAVPLLNVVLALLAGTLLAAPWYLPNAPEVAGKLLGLAAGGGQELRFQQLGETIGPSRILSTASLLYYAGKLVNEQTGFFFALCSAAAAAFLLVTGKSRRSVVLLLLWVVVPLIGFTLIKNKTARNTVPILPALAVLIALAVMQIRRSGLRLGLGALLLVFGVFQYGVSSFAAPREALRLAVRLPLGTLAFFRQPENTSYAIYRASSGDWKAEEILEAIEASRGGKRPVSIVLIPRDALTWMAMEYTSYLKELPHVFIGAVDTPEAVLTADYVLLKRGGFVAPWFLMENLHRALGLLEENRADFLLLDTVSLPEHREYLPIYDREAPQRVTASGVVLSDRLRVVDYTVSETGTESGKSCTVRLRLELLGEGGALPVLACRLLDRKMEVLRVQQVRLERRQLPGEGPLTVEFAVPIPADLAPRFFALDLGFHDSLTRRPLSYQPEYLIYQRKGGGR